MSMSTLGQQLAAIGNSNGNNNTGTTFSTSRRHDDAIGRGLAHSVQVGHAVSKNTLYKPSIIYEDSKKAADVPLATIRENCVASLRQLEEVDPEFGPFVNSLCKPNAQERGLLTPAQNESIDKTIEELVYRLSLRMSIGSSRSNKDSNSNSTLASCLHVMEYLLRKYDIHLRPQTASATLLAMLPHHEEPFFLRLLQLMDVANMPEWAFLRPYAVPGARLGRSIIAGQVSKDVALLRSLGKLSQRNAKLPCCEKSLSFTAAVLVEAVTLQTQRKGTMEEATCQALLPFVVAACRNHKGRKEQVWQNWGLILASTMVETGVLAMEPRNLLVMSIFEGLARQKKIAERSQSSERAKRDFLPLLSNGLTVALSLLMQDAPIEQGDAEQASVIDCRLSMLSPSTHFGFSIAKQTFNVLLRLDDAVDGTNSSIIADCVGHLYGSEGIVEFKHWIASLLVMGFKIIAKTGTKEKKESHSRKVLNLLLSLIEQPELKRLWKDSDGTWIESYTSFVVLNIPVNLLSDDGTDDSSTEVFALSSARNILQSLRSMQKLAYEKGVAHALTQLTKKSDRVKCAEWLGLAKMQNNSDSGQNEDTEVGVISPLSPSEAIALPPRVALENFDYQVRLEAIPTLLNEFTSEDAMDVDEDGETIPQAFLRRFLMDDNDQVALAAATALDDLVQDGVRLESVELGESALEALQKWSSARNLDEAKKVDLLVHSCRFASDACRQIFVSGEKSILWVRLLEVLGVLVAHPDDAVAKEAANAILSAFDNPRRKSKGTKSSRSQAQALLTSDTDLLGGFRRQFRTGNTSELNSRRQLVDVIFESLATSPTQSHDVFAEAIEYCAWAMETFSDEMSDSTVNNLSKYLLSSVDYVVSVPEYLHSTVRRLSRGENSTFEAAIVPFIKAVCSSITGKNGDGVVPLSVLMEIIVALDEKMSIENLVTVALDLARGSPVGCYYSMAPAMALASSSDEGIRGLAVDLLSVMSTTMSKNSNGEDWSVMSALGQYFVDNKSSAVLEGAAFLPRALASAVSNAGDSELARKHLLNSLLSSAAAFGSTEISGDNDHFQNSWLGTGNVIGGYKTVVCILQAMDSAGEDVFPLLSRWGLVGKPLLEALLSWEVEQEVPGYVLDLLTLTVRMTKAIKVSGSSPEYNSAKTTIISSGPSSHGGRSRSYSFGKSDGASFLRPYPRDMKDLMFFILETEADSEILQETRNILFEYVLDSKSWQQEVFSTLDNKTQRRIALGVLTAASEALAERAESTLFSLPLNARDVAELLSADDLDETNLSKMSLVFDYVSANPERLASDQNVEKLLAAMFRQLSILSNAPDTDESSKFARQALLNALVELSNLCLERGTMTDKLEKNKEFQSWMNCLSEMLCGRETDQVADVSLRTQRLVFSILGTFCARFQAAVVSKYIPIITKYASAQTSISEPKSLAICFNLAIPVFMQHGEAAGLSVADLFKAFIESSSTHDEGSRLALYNAFVDALSTNARAEPLSTTSPVGSFVVAALARELRANQDVSQSNESQLPRLAVQILSGVDVPSKIEAIVTMQGYSKQMLFQILDRDQDESEDSLNILSIEELCGISHSGSSEAATNIYEKFCTVLTVAICDVTSGLDLRGKSRLSTEESSTRRLLLLWQDLLLMQSLCHSHNSQGDLRIMAEVVGQAMDWVQSCLPPHVFVAFATNLIKEGETEELRSRAVQLIAERCSLLTPAKPEAALFVEMIPALVDLVGSDVNAPPALKLLEHSAFAALDIIGRNCHPTEAGKKTSGDVGMFVTILDRAADTIRAESSLKRNQSFEGFPVESRQLVSSAAICASTAVKICGPRAVPALPKLITPLLDVLSITIRFSKSSLPDDATEKDIQEQNQARLIQLSILRALKSVVESLPLHLKQFLGSILSVLANMPETFESEETSHAEAVESEFNSLCVAIASFVPSRQLIPAVADAVPSTSSAASAASLLSISTNAIKSAKSTEVSNQTKLVLKTAFHGFQYPNVEENDDITKATNDLVLALVMKQSEVQLRSLYTKLRTWRDDVDSSKQRKYAFWNLSATLSQNLKSIFLPCLTIAFTDAVEELEQAASGLNKESKKSSDGRKKQKLGSSDSADKVQLATLKSLLMCLEVSLRWDAHNGGAWIREMDSQRFDVLLKPLGTLLRCNFPSKQTENVYDGIVGGKSSSSGSVVGCIVALASAAGDETLWKPLNHIVLQACSDANRAEVRKAGVSCLLSLVKSVGEEYMVLIPECLPVLAELLEDSDEEITGLAQDCIALSEELLGESLQDSLL